MRICVLITLLPCTLLAQTSDAPPADRGVLRHPQHWFHIGTHSLRMDSTVRIFPEQVGDLLHHFPASRPPGAVAVNTPPKTCSIPLLRVPMAQGTVDRISVPRPPGKDVDPKFSLPAPPVCEAWKP
jgi:hypothetical protein